ncbi:MAG: type II toxin-antitoxin system Phd/YefM family antitoxin [Solirubrobacterales bacterium]
MPSRSVYTQRRAIGGRTVAGTGSGALDEVRDSGREVTITKRGKPVAKLVPVEPPPSTTARGLVTADTAITAFDPARAIWA